MIREHDRVILTSDLPHDRLKAGDVGTVVHVHPRRRAYELEFVTLDGRTAVVVTAVPTQIRPIGRRDIAHARRLERVS